MNNPVPPNAIEIEQSILAATILSKTMADEIVDTLAPDVFYKAAHQEIFQQAEKIARRGEQVDINVLMESLKSAGLLERVGGASFLAGLLDSPIPPNVSQYCRILRHKAALRQMLSTCQDIIQGCYSQSGDAGEFIDSAQREVMQISVESTGQAVSVGDIVEDRLDHYEELQRNKGQITGVPSMFPDLNYLLHGYQSTDLIILAARPGMGKSAFAVNECYFVGMSGIPAAVFSLEMSKEQLFDRGVAAFSRVNTGKFRDGRFTDENWNQITKTCNKLIDKPIYIDDSPESSFSKIRYKMRQLVRRGVRMFFIDYLQLMVDRNKDSRNLELSDITRGLKLLAKELRVPVVVLSQLSRKVEERNDKHPRLADLRDSGAIEQDADIVMFLYRDDAYNKADDNPQKGMVDLEVAKQRNGPTGMVQLWWKEGITRFESISREEPQGYYAED